MKDPPEYEAAGAYRPFGTSVCVAHGSGAFDPMQAPSDDVTHSDVTGISLTLFTFFRLCSFISACTSSVDCEGVS